MLNIEPQPEHDTSAEFIILVVMPDRRFIEDHVIMILIAEIKNVLIFQVEGREPLTCLKSLLLNNC